MFEPIFGRAPSGVNLSADEVCDRLGISKATFYKWRTVGKGPRGMKIGRHLRFRLEDVEAFEDSVMDSPRTPKLGDRSDGN